MTRTFHVHCGSHDLPDATFTGLTFSAGAFDAAKRYAADKLPSYEVIPGGTGQRAHVDDDGKVYKVMRFEAVDHAAQMGAVLWVYEPL